MPSLRGFRQMRDSRLWTRSVGLHVLCAPISQKLGFLLATKRLSLPKLRDSETEVSEMQCWLDVCKELSYMANIQYESVDERYEHVVSELVTMISNADKWCKL